MSCRHCRVDFSALEITLVCACELFPLVACSMLTEKRSVCSFKRITKLYYLNNYMLEFQLYSSLFGLLTGWDICCLCFRADCLSCFFWSAPRQIWTLRHWPCCGQPSVQYLRVIFQGCFSEAHDINIGNGVGRQLPCHILHGVPLFYADTPLLDASTAVAPTLLQSLLFSGMQTPSSGTLSTLMHWMIDLLSASASSNIA